MRLDPWLPARLDGEAGAASELGEDGVTLEFERAVDPGAGVRVELIAGHDRKVLLSGRVTRSEPGPTVGWHRVEIEVAPGNPALRAFLSSLRKSSHLDIAAREDVESDGVGAGWDRVRFVHDALPELDLHSVICSTSLFGRRLRAPIVISGMTGGSPRAAEVNRRLARTAQELGLGFGLGSQRAMLEDPSLAETFCVRDLAPDVLVLANVGAVQLHRGVSVADCRHLVQAVGADALCLHLNVLQEIIQPEGDHDWSGLLHRIGHVVDGVGVPVVLKETGCGLSADVARRAAAMGVRAFDVGGLGGTHWGWLEGFRTADPQRQQMAATFRGWGIPTVESLREVRAALGPDVPILATGGLRSGLHVALAVALGADAGGLALPFFRAADQGLEEARALGRRIVEELRIAMLCSGCPNLFALRRAVLRGLEP